MKHFNLPDLITDYENNYRCYTTPEGRYPSVTSVLSIEAKDGIEKWKKRVGEERAEFLKKRAADRGNIIHQMMEDYILEKPIKPQLPIYRALFNSIRGYIDKNMKEAWCVELPLYSSRLKTAGRTDLIADFGNGPEVVDFKGSTKEKKESYIGNYHMQACVYGQMFKERTGIPINNYRILIVDEFGNLQIFDGNTKDHLLAFAKLRKQFKEKFGI